jgi:hypothetical protein
LVEIAEVQVAERQRAYALRNQTRDGVGADTDPQSNPPNAVAGPAADPFPAEARRRHQTMSEPRRQNRRRGAANDRRVVISIGNNQWLHFTPYFAGTYFAGPIAVSEPVEDLTTGG